MQENYEMYMRCFLEYPVTRELFEELLRPESVYHYAARRCQAGGVFVIRGNSISLLCVDRPSETAA